MCHSLKRLYNLFFYLPDKDPLVSMEVVDAVIMQQILGRIGRQVMQVLLGSRTLIPFNHDTKYIVCRSLLELHTPISRDSCPALVNRYLYTQWEAFSAINV